MAEWVFHTASLMRNSRIKRLVETRCKHELLQKKDLLTVHSLASAICTQERQSR